MAARASAAAAIALAVGAALATSTSLDFASAPRPALQPRKSAFSIWGLIFPLLLAGAAFVPARAVLPLWLALVCASAWGLAFRARAWRAAAGCLAAAAVLAWTATILAPLEATGAAWLGHAGTGLFAGWRTVAALLGVAIAAPRADGPVALAVASAAVAALAVATRRPAPCVAVAWAAALQRAGPAWASLGLALGGAAGAAARSIV